ncbi:glycerophosphodiester phosphodiesterase [Aliikangiella sp. IMCC44653]
MLVFAHRGDSAHHPENTLASFDAALCMNVDGIEIDIRMVESELVVFHDRWLQGKTNGRGRISERTLAEIRSLDAGKGQKIPTLWETLALVNGRCLVNIELKSERIVVPVLKQLNRALAKLNFEPNQFLISSFNHHLLQEIKLLDYQWRIAPLTASLPIDYAAFASRLCAYSVHVDLDFVNQPFIDDAHHRGLKVFVYTVDEEDDILDLHRMQVDGIFTNYPTRSMVKVAHLNASAAQHKQSS